MKKEDLIDTIYYERKRIIPIIGDKAFVCRWQDINGKTREGSLQEYVNTKLKKKDKITGNYYAQRADKDRGNFANKVKSGIRQNEISLRSEIKDFLVTGNFEVIITTDCFGILKKELGTNYFLTSFQLPAKYDEQKTVESDRLQLPAIYQIFGTETNQWVFTEQDFLLFLHYLHLVGAEKGQGASSLVKYFLDKKSETKEQHLLMPIGCEYLPDWIFRFLWYPISPFNLAELKQHTNGGIWLSEIIGDAFENFLGVEQFGYLDKDEWERKVIKDILNGVTEKIKASLKMI